MNYSQIESPDVVTVAVIYRPPSTSEDAFYDDLSDLFSGMGDVIDSETFMCCGDFHCGGAISSSIAVDLQSLLLEMQQLVSSPTRRTDQTSNLLDLVVVVVVVKRCTAPRVG